MACRMFGYCGTSEADLNELHAGFKRACANDPSLHLVAPNCSQHCHGWGYVIHADNGLFHYRTATPVYEDDAVLPKLKGKFRAIFHARYASDETLIGPIFSHPFVAADNNQVIYFAHNGGVDPKDPAHPKRKVDSEWAMDQFVGKTDFESEARKISSQHTKSALNLLILTIGREPGTPALLQYLNYFNPDRPPEYYRMFEAEMPGGRAVMSSTMTLAESKLANLKGKRVANFGALTKLEI